MTGFLCTLKGYFQTELKPMLQLKYLGDDLFAAIVVTFVAIPLSLAVALATNVGPQVALISVVVGGILGAVSGGSRLSVTGPAVAMSVLLAGVIQSFGFAGLLVVGMICGLLQLTLGIIKLGRIATYIPQSLVLAFTAGIGFLLFFEQIPNALQASGGLTQTSMLETILNLPLYWQHVSPDGVFLVVITLAILAVVPRILPSAYAFILAVVIPLLLAKILHLHVRTISYIPHDLIHPRIVDFGVIHDWSRLLMAGVEVFILASLETLMSTNAIDLMGKGSTHNPNQELIGQGVANLGVALCGGIPVTGVVVRSSVNVLAGAKTRRAAIFHALLVFAIVYWAPQLIEQMPLAILAAILLAASIKMMNFRQIYDLWHSDRLEVLVYIITFLAIIATDLIDGIQTGLLAAFIIVGWRMLKTKAEIKLWTTKNVLRVSLTGSITFFSYERLARIKDYALTNSKIKFVIFEFKQLQNLDGNGAKHLINIAQDLVEAKLQVIFHGLSDEQQQLMTLNTNSPHPYALTIAEYQIKEILEQAGIKHSASDILRHGVVKYISNYAKDNRQLLSTLAQGQKPHTLLITCSDSRLNPNAFFSAEIGEIFIVRNVGNVVPPFMPENIYSEIAAIEYAVSELGVRNIVICAHTECGAVKASIASAESKLGYVGLDNWLGIIKDGFKRQRPNDAYDGVKINLLQQVENLKTYPTVGKMMASQQITVAAWIYDVHSGHMLEWSATKHDFVQIV